ncbi:Protein mak11 [Rhizina undulata]
MTNKRKRATAASSSTGAPDSKPPSVPAEKKFKPLLPPTNPEEPSTTINIQIVTGSYEKTLHGFIATLPISSETPGAEKDDKDSVSLPAKFTDTFLFTAHTSPIGCLTISPPGENANNKRILATASADERINLYTLSSQLPSMAATKLTVATGGIGASSSAKNKHLGTLHHHLNTPTALVFTHSRAKMISAGADGQIHILRARDWSLLSTLKAPKPKAKPVNFARDYGEGYGPRIDTFGTEGYGGGKGGINDIALHPSQKILLSVGRGERGVRMWNLMTGRKAGVLMFSREDVPSKFGNEGIKVEWSVGGEEYAVAFERGVVVFGMDSKPKCRITTTPVSKIHQMKYVTLPTTLLPESASIKDKTEIEVLAISTEDGRVLFYSTAPASSANEDSESENPPNIDTPTLLGVIGGRTIGMVIRIKDFTVLPISSCNKVIVITGSTDGIVRVWDLGDKAGLANVEAQPTNGGKEEKEVDEVKQLGRLLGIYETGRRIQCLGGMVMGGREEEEEEEVEDKSSEESSDDDEEEEEE